MLVKELKSELATASDAIVHVLSQFAYALSIRYQAWLHAYALGLEPMWRYATANLCANMKSLDLRRFSPNVI